MSTQGVNFVSNLQPGNFVFDGAYVQGTLSQQSLPTGPPTNFVAISGGASFGIPNRILTASAKNLQSIIGRDTAVVKSALREALTAVLGGCQSFKFVRVTDGTDMPAKINLVDTASTPANVIILTCVSTGTDGNYASARIDLVSGTAAAGPVYKITINDPFGGSRSFFPIIGYATAGGAYAAATFQANALAAINGTAPNAVADAYFVATAGASIIAPAVGNASLAQASGGTNGDSGLTDTTNLGADAQAASTGAYVFRGALAGGQLVIADCSTTTLFGAIASLAQQEGAIGWETFAAGTDTTTAIATKSTNNMTSDYMGVVMDWIEVNDSFQGQQILVSPIGMAAGVVASLPPYQYPSNHPTNGVAGVITTERLMLGTIDNTEGGQRESNGILWIGPTPNGVLGLPHGLTSSGRQINEVRMLQYLGYSVGTIMARFVGKMLQTTLPIAQADGNDPRNQAGTALRSFFNPMVQAGSRSLSAYSVDVGDDVNTTPTMQQGRLLAQCYASTLTGVQYAIAALAVGNGIQIVTTPVGGQ